MSSSTVCSYFRSSIIKKQIMGLTGLMLCGFAISHLIGNFLLMYSPESFNIYAHTLTSNSFIYVLEGGLLAVFLIHISLAIRLNIENYAARPIKYYSRKHSGRGATFASSSMGITGILILIFLVFHILDFKYGAYYSVSYDGVEMRNLHKLILEYFAEPINVVKYVVFMVAFGIHTSHGFWSAFQSLGINHPKINCKIKIAAKIYAITISLGFIVLPVWSYLQGGQ